MKPNREAFAFGLLLISIIVSGVIVVSVKEHHRSSRCAEMGGIVVNLQCGRFNVIEDMK